MKTTLAIIDAGIRFRFVDGFKQLWTAGLQKLFMGFLIPDAIKAGFDKIVFA